METLDACYLPQNMGLALAGRRKIGILGGTFNPVHIGHLDMAKRAMAEFTLQEIVFLPVGKPPHKQGAAVASAESRYEMLRLATEDEPGFSVSRLEIDRAGFTYTVDTLRELKLLYPDDDFYFIIGADTLFELESWKECETVMRLCRFIVFGRRGFKPSAVCEKGKELTRRYGVQILYSRHSCMEVSSTQIRCRAQAGQSIAGMTTKKVEDYIRRNGVYQGQ